MNIEMIKKILREKSLRVTNARLSVAKVFLENIGNYLSSEEVFKKISKSKKLDCDQVTVYRILDAFEKIGILHKGQFFGEANRYKLCDGTDSCHQKIDHEHFFKCIICKKVEGFSDCVVINKEKELTQLGYTNLKHHLEITGTCPQCSK